MLSINLTFYIALLKYYLPRSYFEFFKNLMFTIRFLFFCVLLNVNIFFSLSTLIETFFMKTVYLTRYSNLQLKPLILIVFSTRLQFASAYSLCMGDSTGLLGRSYLIYTWSIYHIIIKIFKETKSRTPPTTHHPPPK